MDIEDCRTWWKWKQYYEGNCTTLKANGRRLNLILSYQSSDWIAGWTHFMDGFTVFYSDRGNHALEDAKSFQVWAFDKIWIILYNLYYMFRYDILNFILKATNENIAMVTLHVENITWLGKPYSICVREPDYGFAYTKQNCMLECEGRKVHPKRAILNKLFCHWYFSRVLKLK